MADDDEAAEVRQVWSALGLPGVIDVHTHFMPKSVMDKVWQYFDSAGPLVGREWPITYRTAESERVQMLRQFGVRGFTALVYPHKPQMAAWLNQWAVSSPGRRRIALPPRRFTPSRTPATTSRRRSTAEPRSSKRTSKWAGTSPTTRCSTRSGEPSRTPRYPWSFTAAPARRPASTPGPSRYGFCCNAIRGCG